MRVKLFRGPLLALIATLLAFSPRQARASVFIVTMTQQGSDVDVAGSGSFDVTGLTQELPGNSTPYMNPGEVLVGAGLGPVNFEDLFYSGAIDGPSSFGPGAPDFPASGTGTPFLMAQHGLPTGGLILSQFYDLGSQFTDTSVYPNSTIASLGVTPGVYTWTWTTARTAWSWLFPNPPASRSSASAPSPYAISDAAPRKAFPSQSSVLSPDSPFP